MQFVQFIPCRLGEPLTAIELSNPYLFIGSISGYICRFDIISGSVHYYPVCYPELIRDLCAHNDLLYVAVGDISIAVHDKDSLQQVRDIPYFDFKHSDTLCQNYYSFIKKGPSGDPVGFLAMFPTSDVERLSKFISA